MSSNSESPPAFSPGEVMALGFLVAFYRKSLEEAPLPDARFTNRLELAEARMPAIVGRLREDPDVLDNGRRFHELATEYLPPAGREREDFIALLEDTAGLKARLLPYEGKTEQKSRQ